MPQLNPNTLSRVSLFAGVASDGLQKIHAAALADTVHKQKLVFRQGGKAERIFVLVKGCIRIVQTSRGGDQIIARFITPGELFGTLPIFTNGIFSADAIAVESSETLSWSKTELIALAGQYPCIALNLIRIIGEQLTEVQCRLCELTTKTAEQRIAHALIRLGSKAGQSVGDLTAILIPVRRKDLAEISGTTLHTASRTLAAWEKAGMLMSQSQKLFIRDLSGIKRIANELRR